MEISCPRTKRAVESLRRALPDQGSYLDYGLTVPDAAVSHLHYRLTRKYAGVIGDESVESRTARHDREALVSFLETEERLGLVDFSNWGRSDLGSVLMLAKQRIASVLGSFNLKEYSGSCGITSGASTSRSRRLAHPINKFRGTMEVTRNCALLAAHFVYDNEILRRNFQERYGYGSVPADWFKVVPGSVQFSVPKQWDKCRLAAKEPDLNLILQKGIGNMIRRRLKRVGIDLDDNSWNQHLALIGSRTGAIATVDMSSASDLVSLTLVRELLPADWYRYIWTTRSPAMILLDGSILELRKVSTMGNGFTFELESLIFWGLCKGVQDYLGIQDRRLAVYGDDICIHHECCPLLFDVLESVGLKVNVEKSFVRGPYRESCGSYFYLGQDIKGFYIRDEIWSLGDACKLANDILSFCSRVSVDPPWKYIKWLFIGLFNRWPPLVPANADERSGLRWWPSVGVRFSLTRQTYCYTELRRDVEKSTRKICTDKWSYAVALFLGNLPGLIDPGITSPRGGGIRQVELTPGKVVRPLQGEVETLRRVRGSTWEYPNYPTWWSLPI